MIPEVCFAHDTYESLSNDCINYQVVLFLSVRSISKRELFAERLTLPANGLDRDCEWLAFPVFMINVQFSQLDMPVDLYFSRFPSSKSFSISFIRLARVSSRLALSIHLMKFFL